MFGELRFKLQKTAHQRTTSKPATVISTWTKAVHGMKHIFQIFDSQHTSGVESFSNVTYCGKEIFKIGVDSAFVAFLSIFVYRIPKLPKTVGLMYDSKANLCIFLRRFSGRNLLRIETTSGCLAKQTCIFYFRLYFYRILLLQSHTPNSNAFCVQKCKTIKIEYIFSFLFLRSWLI